MPKRTKVAPSAEVQRLAEEHGAEIRMLEGRTMAGMLEVYIRAREQVIEDWLKSWTAKQRQGLALSYTEAKTLNAMRQIEAGIDEMARDMGLELSGVDSTTSSLALRHLSDQIDRFSHIAIPLPLKAVVGLSNVKKLLAYQHKQSLDRYGQDTLSLIKMTIQKGLVAHETPSQVSERLMEALPAGHEAWREWNAVGNGRKTVPEINEETRTGPYYWAERIVRTEVMNSYGVMTGMQMEDLADIGAETGFVVKKQWSAAWEPRTCEWCAAMDGEVREIDEPFGDFNGEPIYHPTAHPFCLPEGTRCVTDGPWISGFRALYDGDAIEFVFSDGTRLSTTVNHLLLTDKGFAAAKFLCEGDDVLCCPDFERMVASNPDNDRKPTRIEEIVKTLSKSSGMATVGVPVSPEYLHGDGEFVKSNIDVVWPNRFLGSALYILMREPFAEKLFGSGHSASTPLFGGSLFREFLHWAGPAADGLVSGRRETAPFFRGRSGHPKIHGFRASSLDDTEFPEPRNDSTPRNIEAFSKGLDRFSGVVERKKIVNINVFPFHGFVYDLQSQSSLYIANSVLSSNCRCSEIPYIENAP